MSLTATDRTDAGVLIRVALLRPSLDIHADGATADVAALTAALRVPFFVRIDRDGRLGAVHLPGDLEPFAATVSRSVAASFQFVRGRRAEAQRWEVDEEDVTGTCRAAYESDGEEGAYAKRKLRYVRVNTAEGPVLTETVGRYDVDDESRITVDRYGRLERLEGRGTLRIAPQSGGLRFRVETVTTVRRLEARQAPEQVGAFARSGAAFPEGGLAPTGFPDGTSARRTPPTLGELMGRLQATAGDADAGKERAALLGDLGALLRRDPATASALRDAVIGDGTGATTIIGALSDAATPEAQAALVDVMQSEEVPGRTRWQALTGLGLAENPTVETGQALLAFVDDALASGESADGAMTATYALGSHIRGTHESAEGEEARARTAPLLERLLALLANAQTPEEQVVYLRALGNSGDGRAFGALRRYLDSPHVPVRAAATWGLRFLAYPEVDRLLLAVLTTDPASAPRAAAVEAVAYRTVADYLAPFEATLRSGEWLEVRRAIVTLLARSLRSCPDCRPLLAWAAANDPDDVIRQAAGRALTPSAIPDTQVTVGTP